MKEVLSKWFENIGLRNFIVYISEIPLFFLKPKQFYKQYENLDSVGITKRTSVYYLLSYLLIYFLFKDCELRELLGILFLSIVISMILIICQMFIYRIILKEWNIKKATISVLSISTFFIPIMLFSYKSFIHTEIYLFYFVYGLAFLLGLVYLIIISVIVYSDSIKKKFTSILLNLLIYNLAITPLFMAELIWHEKVNFLADPIYEEYESVTQELNFIDKFPAERLIFKFFDKQPTYTFCFTTLHDSVCSSSTEEDKIYFEELEIEMVKVKALKERKIKFQWTKGILDEYSKFLNNVKLELDFRYDKIPTTLTEREINDTNTGQRIGCYYKEIINNQKVFSPLMNYTMANNNLINYSEYASIPLYTSAIFALPIGLVQSLIDTIKGPIIDKDEMKLIRIK
jgi:hypothetical protein